MWTRFWDMCSGGGQKEKWGLIYIEASLDEACEIFENEFGHDPNNVTCECCGRDYSIDESPDLLQLTGYHRGCGWVGCKYEDTPSTYKYATKYMSSEDFLKESYVRVIYKEEYQNW